MLLKKQKQDSISTIFLLILNTGWTVMKAKKHLFLSDPRTRRRMYGTPTQLAVCKRHLPTERIYCPPHPVRFNSGQGFSTNVGRWSNSEPLRRPVCLDTVPWRSRWFQLARGWGPLVWATRPVPARAISSISPTLPLASLFYGWSIMYVHARLTKRSGTCHRRAAAIENTKWKYDWSYILHTSTIVV